MTYQFLFYGLTKDQQWFSYFCLPEESFAKRIIYQLLIKYKGGCYGLTTKYISGVKLFEVVHIL